MNPARLIAAIALAAGLALAAPVAAEAPMPIIPAPISATTPANAAPVALADGDVIVAPRGDAKALWTARYLADLIRRTRGLSLVVQAGGTAPAGRTSVVLTHTPGPPSASEAYRLTIAGHRAEIQASGEAGLFYGAVSLWQLVTADGGRGPVSLAATEIQDAPRFGWRGLMIDSARHYQSPAYIERLIDLMALHKLNVLHWHLTDDQAWRLEIKAFPRLTEIGGWRTPLGGGPPEGGIYTQDQVREIVAYAAHRHIVIVPEIEMPGHATAAILAYPALGSGPLPPPGIRADWGVFPYIYNVDDQTFAFLEGVLDEVMRLFPGRYIHVGGDEALKDQWKASPAVQARMKALGITDEDALQSYFTRRIDAYLSAHGRRLIGWDEILNGPGLPASATVMSWHGISGAVTAATSGHDTVLAPAPTLYFDHRQSDRPQEPPGWGDVISLKDVYDFDPAPAALTEAQRSHILGVQANVWTERLRTDAQLDAAIFPRLAAVAEAAWSPAGARGWDGFAARLPAQMARYQALGVGADDAALAVTITPALTDAPGQASVTLSSQFGLGQIRYQAGGAEPTAASPLYAAPFEVATPATVKAASFIDGRRVSAVSAREIDQLTIRRRLSQELKLCSDKLVLSLEDRSTGPDDGVRMLIDVFDPCWIYPAARMDGIGAIAVQVGHRPFNFQAGDDVKKIPLHAPATPDGELEVRQDGCDGAPIAVLPLAPAKASDGLTTLRAALPPLSGQHDLCFRFTARSVDPMWMINWVQLLPKSAEKSGG